MVVRGKGRDARDEPREEGKRERGECGDALCSLCLWSLVVGRNFTRKGWDGWMGWTKRKGSTKESPDSSLFFGCSLRNAFGEERNDYEIVKSLREQERNESWETKKMGGWVDVSVGWQATC